MIFKSNYTSRLILSGIMTGLFFLCGCSSLPENSTGAASVETEALHSINDTVKDDINYTIDVYDPWEGFNRGVYRFNARFDQYIFLPTVNAYTTVMPDVAEDAVSNFFNNILELNNLTNAILQLKPTATLKTIERILINTTVGVFGLFDVASKLEIYEYEEDFGQTLGYYNVGDGPYLVLPILGPSNLRDVTGNVVDVATLAAIDPLNLDDHSERETAFLLLNAVDRRHQTGFRYYQTGSPFEYELVRLLYTRKRQLDIER